MAGIQPLAVHQLCQRCDPGELGLDDAPGLSTDSTEAVGQARAMEALRFGVGMRQDGYNIFALGPHGVGKQSIAAQLLREQAGVLPVPDDWCYVNNFDDAQKPRLLRLPPGRGAELRRDMAWLVEELKNSIPAAFDSDEYRARAQEIEQELKERQENAIDEVRRGAGEKSIALLRTPGGFAFAPARGGDVLSPEEFEKLPEDEQRKLEEDISALQERLRKVVRQIPQWRSESRERMRQLARDVAQSLVEHSMDVLKQRYEELPQVLTFLEQVESTVVDNVGDFRESEEPVPLLGFGGTRELALKRYEVNLLVDNSGTQGAPVIYEDHPTYQNLVGRIEHLSMMGALVTDFTLVKCGALHRANGGYLILDAHKLLQHPYAWDGLKRALLSGEVRIQSLEQMLSLASTVSLEPEPVPLNLKVVLLGERVLYYLLHQLDPEFTELFKVAADFDDVMDRRPEHNRVYARLIVQLARRHQLRRLEPEAVAAVIDRSSRLAEDSQKLSVHMRSIVDLLCEADYWAGGAGSSSVGAAHVRRAIDAQRYRSGRIRERVLESIARNSVFIDTQGERIGTINGLTIVEVGGMIFGAPSRITARVRVGEGELVDIEREVDLSGPFHSKGVLILQGFLGGRYAARRPLSLAASLVFEQSYAEVDGDSASSTELYVLLSALANVPIRQSLAVTGSVNQHGEVQPIGGVNEKIEGFFDVCMERGLTGEQGVLIPEANTKNLMLRHDVVEAAAEGMFHIYPVRHVDEGIELLTGIAAGDRGPDGEYLPGTINQRVEATLLSFAESRHEFVASRKSLDEHDQEEFEHDDNGVGDEPGV